MEREVVLKLIPTGKEHEYIEVSVYYNKGGRNMFTSRVEPRGFWVSVAKIQKNGNWVKRFAWEGRKMFLLEVKRFSQKAMDEAVEIAEGKYREMVERVYGIEC